MKKTICLLLAISMVLSLWGCGAEIETEPTSAPSNPTTPTAIPTLPSVPTEPATCNHTPEIIQTIPATCAEPGKVIASCPLCGEEFIEVLPALEHDFTAASCTSAPLCTLCGYTSGSALGHVYTDGICIHCGDELPQDLPADCDHEYTLVSQIAPSCTAEGRMDYECHKCDHTYSQVLDATDHRYSNATCTEAQQCLLCDQKNGQPLGHQYQDGACSRCGSADPDAAKEVTYTVTVRSDKGVAIEGVTVSVYTGEDSPAGTGRTNAKGVATMTLMSANSYRVVLSNIPAGLSAKESYTFTSTRVNINLSTVAQISPDDHSKANYKVGATMGDFTLSDTDGNVYTLSQLLQEKDLIILNFWFVNCIPCQAEFPYFEDVHLKYENVQLLTLNHIDRESDILALREQMGVTFPMISESIGFKQGFGIDAYPTTVFIDRTGKILRIKTGEFSSQAELDALIESLI